MPQQKGEDFMAHLFVIAGHGAGDPGATGNGYTEAERVRVLANRIKTLGGDDVTLGDTNRNWYEDGGISSLSIPKDWCIIELHMDSASASARGGHVIIKEGFSPDGYDNALANVMAKYFPGRANLIVGRSNLANVNRAAARGLNYRLLECGFITNTTDVNTFNSEMDSIATDILASFGIGASAKMGTLGAPVFVKQKETLDIGINFNMPNNEGRFRWLLYDVNNDKWETLVKWTASNWISLKRDKSKKGYLIQVELYDLDTKEAHLLDKKVFGTDAGTQTVITGTYANTRSDGSVILGCSSNNENVDFKIKLYNTKTKKWFKTFVGQWASFVPEKGVNYIVQFEAYSKDGVLLDYRAIGIGS